ncbi:MAG: Rossmann fold nucleotide-binding protein [Allobranchiibius sp.]
MTTREITSTQVLRDRLQSGRPLHGVRLQDLDLQEVAAELLKMADLSGLVVLGGIVPAIVAEHLRTAGALVFPTDPELPINPYRSRLYDPRDLYRGLEQKGYGGTADKRAYDWLLDPQTVHDAYVTIMRAIHDDSIGDALDERLEGKDVVGVMGGHAELRTSAAYADAARLGNSLAEGGTLVLTGGGPGAMEAASLGACLTDPSELGAALAELTPVPSFEPDITAWARTALAVREEYTDTAHRHRCVGVPTWFYGHEPPQVFCGGVAKFFSNALREDILLARCNAGIIVLPGAAGTVQEIFQATTRMYYANPETTTSIPPLILVGAQQWTRVIPVWGLLTRLAQDRAMQRSVHLVDSTREAAQIILGTR